MNRSSHRMQGALMLELAISLPLFLFVLFEAWWIVNALRARTALITSLGDALRYGVTRGDTDNFPDGEGPLGFVNAYWKSGTLDDRMKTLLYQRAGKASFDMHTVSDAVMTVFGGVELRTAPLTYAYTLVYMHEYMRIRVGSGLLRYPCMDKPNCLKCYFLNPDAYNGSADPEDPPKELDISKMPPDVVGMQCEFRPDFGFLNPMMRLAELFLKRDENDPLIKFTTSAYVTRASEM